MDVCVVFYGNDLFIGDLFISGKPQDRQAGSSKKSGDDNFNSVRPPDSLNVSKPGRCVVLTVMLMESKEYDSACTFQDLPKFDQNVTIYEKCGRGVLWNYFRQIPGIPGFSAFCKFSTRDRLDRKTDRPRDGETERRDRETERQRDGETGRQR